jgi:hypothetical protein
MAGTANALNLTQSGVVSFDGVSIFTGSGAGTSGQLLQSKGSATNAAYTTATYPSTGGAANTLLRSNGTNWINSTGLQVNSNGVASNANQPCFQLLLNTSLTNVTGDGTVYPIVFDVKSFDQASNITLNSGGKTVFQPSVAGKYLFCFGVQVTNVDPLCTTGYLSINSAIGVAVVTSSMNNPGIIADANSTCGFYFSCILNLATGNSYSFDVTISGSSKTVGIKGISASPVLIPTFASGYLLC